MIDKKIIQNYGKVVSKNVARGLLFIVGVIGLGVGDPIQAVKRMSHGDFNELLDKDVIVYLINRTSEPIEGYIKVVKKGYIMMKENNNKIIYINTDRIDYIKTKIGRKEDNS